MNELVSASQERTRLRTSQFRGGLRAVLRSGLDVVLPPLCPVPLHWRRLWGRRFNRSATLAGAISGQCGVPVLMIR